MPDPELDGIKSFPPPKTDIREGIPEVFVKAAKEVKPFDVGSSPSLPDMGNLQNKEVGFYDMINGLGAKATGRGQGMTVSHDVLEANKRFPVYNPNIENHEDYFAQRQGVMEQATYGVLKGVNLAATTVAGGFGMVGGAIKSAYTGRLADIWDNPYMNTLDDWNNKVDNEFLPNYYKQKSLDADWYQTSNWMNTNFLFDKLVKNSGFAVGAMVSGNMASSLLGVIGRGLGVGAAALAGEAAMAGTVAADSSQAFKLFTPLLRNTARAFSAGKNIEVANAMTEGISSIADLEAKSSAIANIAKTTNTLAKINDVVKRTAIAAYSSAGEASFEALQTAKSYREKLITEYKATHGGDAPIGTDLAAINSEADVVGKTSFLGNLALLSLTEYAQLPKLMGSTYSAQKQAANSLIGRADDVLLREGKYVAKAPSTRLGRNYARAKGVLSYVFDPKEGGQELGQYALEIGAQNYYKKHKESNDASVWTDGFLYGTFGTDETGKRVGALVSKEGIESGILGAVTGGLMQARSTFREGKERKTNTENLINTLNSTPSFRDAFKDKLRAANRDIALQQQYQAHVINGQELEARDVHTDIIHNYLMPRIKYGRYDMFKEDMKELRDGGSTEQGLAELKGQGLANANDTITTFKDRIAKMEKIADTTVEIHKSHNLRFGGEVLSDKEGKPILTPDGKQIRKYPPSVLDKLTYDAAKIADYDVRLPVVNQQLSNHGIATSEVLEGIIKENKPNREAVDGVLQEINNLQIPEDNKDALKKSLTDVVELALRRKAFLADYNAIVAKPLNYIEEDDYEPGEKSDLPVPVTQEVTVKNKVTEEEKALEVGKEYSLDRPLLREKNIFGEELIFAPKLKVISQTLGGELEVQLPSGKVTFMTPTEFKKYTVSDEENDTPEIRDILDKVIKDVLDKPEYADLKKEFNSQDLETIFQKLSFVNQSDNPKAQNDVEKAFNEAVANLIKKREALARKRAQMLKKKEDLEKAQKEIIQNSGDVPGVDTTTVENAKEPAKKEATILFKSSTTESEKWSDPTKAPPHIKRARQFFSKINNIKLGKNESLKAILVTHNQLKDLGLEGLVQMSYGVPTSTPITDIKDATDVNNGWVAQVFVLKDKTGSYFVSAEGEKLGKVGEQISLDEVVFQTMPTTSLLWSNGESRARANQQAEAAEEAAAYALFREGLFAQSPEDYNTYDFEVSRGFPIELTVNGEKEVNHVSGILVNEEDIPNIENLVIISTVGTVAHKGQNLTFPKGVPLLQNGSTLVYLNNRKFTKNEASTIFKVMELISADISRQLTKGAGVKLKAEHVSFIQNLMYWNIGDTKTDNQIFIDIDNLDVRIGTQSYDLLSLGASESAIVDQLQNGYFSTNNKTLKKSGESFTEFYVDKAGNLAEREWQNYQTYLLASKYPDGSAREAVNTPLTTPIAAPTADVNYSFEQRYSTLNDLDFPVPQGGKKQPAKKAPTPPTATTDLGNLKFDGTTEIKATTNVGEVTFKATMDANKNVIIDPESLSGPGVVAASAPAMAANVKAASAGFYNDAVAETDYAYHAKALIATTLSARYNAFLKMDIKSMVKEMIRGRAITDFTPTEQLALNDSNISTQEIRKQAKDEVDAEDAAQQPPPALTPEAEIEKNRQDDIEHNEAIPEGSYLAPQDSAKESLLKFREYLTDVLSWPKMAIAYNNGELVLDHLGKEIRVPAKINQLGGAKTILEISAKDVINARYDLELSILKPTTPTGKQAAAVVVKTAGRFASAVKKGMNPSNLPPFRLVGFDGKSRMTNSDLEAFKEWAKENLPNIPYEVLSNLIVTNYGEKAWGVFENGVIKFVKGGLRGTEYHEAFEAVFRGFLSGKEQEDLLEEFKAKPGYFTDRQTGKRIMYSDATDNQAKERIADDFADYRLGKLPARNLGERIQRFFKMIMDFFKSFNNKPTLKSELFKSINEGSFKKRQLSEEYLASDQGAEYRTVEGLTEEESNAFVEDMLARSSGIIFRDDRKDLLYSPKPITAKELFNEIRDQYAKTPFVIEEESFMVLDLLGDKAWDQLVVKTKDAMRARNIVFEEDEQETINSENANKNDYLKETFSVEGKKNSTRAIKFMLSTLIERIATNQEKANSLALPAPKASAVGGFKVLNFNKVYSTLLNKLTNTTDINVFRDKLVELVNSDANFVSVFSKLGGNFKNRDFNFGDFDFHDWRLFIDFFQVFTKQTPKALIQYNTDGTVYIGSANLFSAAKQTKNKWVQNMRVLAKEENSLIKYDRSTKTYKVDYTKMVSPAEFKVILTKLGIKEIREGEYVDKNGVEVSKDKLNEILGKAQLAPPKLVTEMIAFLNKIGITYNMATYKKFKSKAQQGKKSEKDIFANKVAAIHGYLGSNPDIISLSGEILHIEGPITELAELQVKVDNPNLDPTFFGVEGKRVGASAENNYPSLFENDFNESETLDELLLKRPDLLDTFSQHSVLLEPGGPLFDKDRKRRGEIKVSHIQGTKDVSKNKGKTTSNLGRADRYVQQINNNVKGNYYIIIPADGTTEWMINMGNNISFKEVESGKSWKKIHNIFGGYLVDEVNLALDADNRKLKHVKDRAKELRFFKDILNEEDLKNINAMIAANKSFPEIEKYIEDHKDSINQAVTDFIQAKADKALAVLRETNKVRIAATKKVENEDGTTVDVPTAYSFKELESSFALDPDNNIKTNEMSEETLNNLMTFINANYIINNIEFHKVLFGDPYQFKESKGILDIVKRIKSFLSPRRTTFDSPEFNTFLNTRMNSANEIPLTENDYGWQKFKDHASISIVSDHIIRGSLARLNSVYGKNDESDGFSWMRDSLYREVKLKNRQWSEEDEAWHQWQMAYTRRELAKKNKYDYKKNKALEAQDNELLKKPAPKGKLSVLKPIVTGNALGKSHLMINKMAQMPIYYSMVEGTNLENLFVKMWKEKTDYIVVESGAKVGVEDTHPLYNKNGTFNEEAFNNKIQVPWKAYGIQVETSSEEEEKTQPRGSQLTKLSSLDLFDNGEPTSKEAHAAYLKNKDLLDKMHAHAYVSLLKRLGVEDNGDNYVLTDGKVISQTLMKEMLRRTLSDNAKETLELDENNQFKVPFEASTSYLQIRNILYSLIHKSLISPTMSGGAHVQVPVTLFEDSAKGRRLALKEIDEEGHITWRQISKKDFEDLSPDEKERVMLTDDTLKFYTKEKPYCEIMLPHWFRNSFPKKKFPTDASILKYLDTKEGQKILTGIGFRIPTQAVSSVEVFKVKGFLPQYMGATVVVPSEITSKAGSDFDIDKLNMYLKSIYVDANGNVRLINLLDTEERTKAFFEKVYDDTIAKQIAKITNYDTFRAKALDILEQLDTVEGYVDQEVMEELFSDEDYDFYRDHYDVIQQILDQATEEQTSGINYLTNQIEELKNKKEELTQKGLNDKLKADYVSTMYKKALENEYYKSLEELITLPENFERLIKPVDDGGLKSIAEHLDKLRGYDETTIKNRTLDMSYMTDLRHAFVIAKKWVGIAAVHITGLSIKQKTQVYINPKKFANIPLQDQKYLRDGKVNIDHNKVPGTDNISLSGTKVSGSLTEYISDRYSGYATSFVDVAKDPYILKLIQNDLTIGIYMFLENIGVGKKTAYFLNQPIIDKYVRTLENNGKSNLFHGDSISAIKEQFTHKLETHEDYKAVEMNLDQKALEDNISDYYTKGLSMEQMIEQRKILDEFLKYAVMSKHAFKFTQSLNYDTATFSNSESFYRKTEMTKDAEKNNMISSANDVLNKSFIGVQKEYIGQAMNALGAILKLEHRDLRAITEKVLAPYIHKPFMTEDVFNIISTKVKSEFMNYIIQTKAGYNALIKELLVDENNVASRLLDLQTKYPDNILLQSLEPVTSNRPDGAKTVKLTANIKEASDENMFTGMMRELRDENDELNKFFNDLVKVAILQGIQPSAVSFLNIVPLENYSALLEPVLSQLVYDTSLNNFTNGLFQKNNFKDDNIVPTARPQFFLPEGTEPYDIDPYGNHLYRYETRWFPTVKSLGINASDRRIMIVSEKFNSDITENEIVKVPRVITKDNGERIDFETGATITDSDYMVMKNRGDFYLNDFFGYQKVRYLSGEPLIIYDEYNGEQYIYKMVNLLGDGERATEHYTELKPSVIDNGSVKIEQEMTDEQIVDSYGGQVTPLIMTPKLSIEEIKEIKDPEQFAYEMLNYLGGKKVSRGILKIDGQNWYLDSSKWSTKSNSFGGDLFVHPDGKDNPDSDIIYIASYKSGDAEYFTGELNTDPTSIPAKTPAPVTPVTTKAAPKGEKVKEGVYVNQSALTQEEQMELFSYLKPYLESQAAKTNKGANASKMIGLGLRWDYKSNNPGKEAVEIPDIINPSNKSKYGYYTESANNKPLAPISPRFRELMEKATGIDMTNYDGAIINLYDNTSFISAHNDVDESRTAIKYPVIGVNLGGTGNFSIESKEDPKQLNLQAGTAYVFGVNGVNRDVFHRTFPQPQKTFLPRLMTKIDGKTYAEGSYRITITMRRVMPLTEGMPKSPAILDSAGKEIPVTPPVINTEQQLDKLHKEAVSVGFDSDYLHKALINGKPAVISSQYYPKQSIRGYSDIYAHRQEIDGVYVKKLAKPFTIPGYEDLNFALTHDKDVIELTTGRPVYNSSVTQKETESFIRNNILERIKEVDVREIISNQPKIEANIPGVPITPYGETTIPENPVEDRQVKVEKFNITIRPDGKMFYDNGNEVTDQVTKNKVNIRKELQDGTLRVSTYNKSEYFVLLDDRILGSGKTNKGKETVTDPKIKEAILAKAILHKDKNCG